MVQGAQQWKMPVPLRNRVDPGGNLHAVSARGLFTGNRGILHDPDTRSLAGRRWTTRAWIVCTCCWQGRRRDVMGRNGRGGGAGWTELFFLDEVTALAAGHRPCFLCRRAAARAFATACAPAFENRQPSAPEMDVRLHRERLLSSRPSTVPEVRLGDLALPDGAIVRGPSGFLARCHGAWLAWSFEGYGPAAEPDPDTRVGVVTPALALAALSSGFLPVWHPSATSRLSKTAGA